MDPFANLAVTVSNLGEGNKVVRHKTHSDKMSSVALFQG